MADQELFNGTPKDLIDDDHNIAFNKPGQTGSLVITWLKFKNFLATLFVRLIGAQNIDGIKTFIESPIVPDPTTDLQAVNFRTLQVAAGLTGTKENISTGIIFGGELVANIDPTKFDIEAGEIYIVDSYTDPETPVFTKLTWVKQLNIPVTNIGSQLLTFVTVIDDGAGNPQFNQNPTSNNVESNRDSVQLGVLVHSNLATISKISSLPNWNKDTDLKVLDITGALGRLNITGNIYGPNGTNKNLDKTAGEMFAINANYGNDKKSPNTINLSLETNITFLTVYGDSGTVVGSTNVIDTDNYNPLGAGGLIPIPDGMFTTHGIFFSPETCLTIVHYGQYIYDSLKKAIDSWTKEQYNVVPELDGVSLRGVLAFQKGETDLSDPYNVKFIDPGTFGIKTNQVTPSYSKFAESIKLVDALSYDKQDITIINDGGTLYAEIEKEGGGDMIYVFGQKEHILNCITGPGTGGKARIALTPGASASAPVENYVYVIAAANLTVILQASTTRPTGQFAYIGKFYIPDATTFNSIGSYVEQRYTDAKAFDGRSSVQRTNERIRVLPAEYESGMLQTVTIDSGPAPDSVDISITSGKAWQKHLQNTPALSVLVDDIFIVNHPTAPFTKISDLNDVEALQTSDGTSLADTRFNWVVWLAVNKDTATCKFYLNLPNGSYSTDSNAISDTDRTAVTTIPKEFRGVGILIARMPIRHRALTGGIYENLASSILGIQVIDLRGQKADVGAGGGLIPASNVFSADLFRVYDPTSLFELAFDLSLLSANRSYIFPDKAGTVALLDDIVSDLSVNRINPVVAASALDINFATKQVAWAFKAAGGPIDVGENITITRSNDTNKERDYIFLNVNGGTREIIIDAGTISNDPRYDSATNKLTLPIGVYLLERKYDGTSIILNIEPGYKTSELTDKATPVDADITEIEDSAASFKKKKLTWANLKATLLAYFAGIFAPIVGTQSVVSSLTPSPVGSKRENEYYLTALEVNATFAAPSGTPVNGNTLFIRIEDNGTARTLAWNAIYRLMSEALPTTTVLGKILYIGFVYNSTDSKWDCIGINQEA